MDKATEWNGNDEYKCENEKKKDKWERVETDENEI